MGNEMKALVIAAGLIGIGATAASAEPWNYPYERRHHKVCQEKARELHRYEHRAGADGHYGRRELRIIDALRHDLKATCRGYRWKG
jgi:hypothetical protein